MTRDQEGNQSARMYFKAPEGCRLTVTLNTSSDYTSFRQNDGGTRRDHLYIYDGLQTDNGGTAVRDWYNGHLTDPSFTSTAGGWVTLYFYNGRDGNGNDRKSKFRVTITCNCCTQPDWVSGYGCPNDDLTVGGTANLRVTGGDVTWSATPAGIVNFSTTTGTNTTITGASAGTATITATITAANGYCAGTLTCNITVSPCGHAEQQIGSETNTTNYSPLYYYYGNNYNQIIYPHDQICTTNDNIIHAIAFEFNTSTSTDWKNNVYIYMGTTNKTSFNGTDDWITSGLTEVYHGPLNNDGASGWKWINLNSPYHYTGTDNLVVAILDLSDDYGGSQNTVTFRYTTTTNNTVLFYYNDDDPITNISSPEYESDGITTDRPNTKFCVDCHNCTDWVADFHYTTTSASIVAGTSYTNTTLVNNTAYNESYTISPSMAGVSISSSGEVTTPAYIEQTFTVTATIQRGGEYCDKKTTYTLDVGDGCNKIGNGSTQIDGPIVPGYRNSYMEMIYTYSEIGEYCRISRIAFNYKQTGTVSRHLKIYMAQTNTSGFDNRGDFIGSNNMTLVWEGDWTFSEGWNVFELTTPFDYTSGNIIIGVNSHASYYEHSHGFYGESDDYNRVLSSFYGPEEITSDHMDTWCTNHSSYYEINHYRPNIKFCMEDCCNINATIEFGD